MLKSLKEFSCEEIELLGSVYGAVDFKYRESSHSFTGTVLEVHFEDGDIAVAFSKEMEIQIGYFCTVRVVSETRCYVSVPCKSVEF